MDDALAHRRLAEVLALIDQWGETYDKRWGKHRPYNEQPGLDHTLRLQIDNIRSRTRFARDIVSAMGQTSIADRVVERDEGLVGGHPFTQARLAIIEAIAILAQREELAEIVGPVGPQLSATALHPTIWGAAAHLWDDGHFRAAVQTAATALEGILQATAGPAQSGENLGSLFSTTDAPPGSPRLRIPDLAPGSKTWKSAHEGASALVRGSFLGARNLMSHPGWPDPGPSEALEMITILSYIARLVDRSDPVMTP
jgi:hypothetical protein